MNQVGREPAVLLRGWGFRHHGRDSPTLAGVDLSIERGQVVLLLEHPEPESRPCSGRWLDSPQTPATPAARC